MRLFDRKGQPVEVPDDQVHDALSSGEYGAPKGTRIPVKMDGQIGTVPIERLGAALDGDAQVVPQSEYDEAELQAKYGDAGHGALAFGTEALNTATLGASNAAIRGIGGKGAVEEVRKSQEANPFATPAGTVFGAVVPALADIASGGTLTPELAAVAAERAAARGSEGGIARHLAAGAERRLLGAGEPGAAAAGAERRLLGAGEAGSVGAGAERPVARVGQQPPVAQRPVFEGSFEPHIPIHAEEEMLGEVIPNAPGLGGQPARALPTSALARRPNVVDGVIEEVPRLPGASQEMLGEVVQNVPRVAPDVEAEILKDYGALRGHSPRALPPGAALQFEEVGARAVQDVPEFADVIVSRLPAVPMAPEVAAAEEAARVGRLVEAAQVVEGARAAGKVAERAAAEAAGKGVIRQTIEGAVFGPTRAVGFAGDLVEDAVRGIVGREAETALGRIAQDAVVKGARGAVEGGAYSVGAEAGHQFLQDDPALSAERLSTAWFNGALLGGGFGAATGALGRGAKEAIGKVVGNEGISKFLSDKAGEHMWHAAGGTKKMTASAEKYAGGAAKVGNLIREDAEQLMGRTPRTREEMFELSQLMQQKHNASLDTVLNHLDEQTPIGAGLKLGDLVKKVERAERELRDRAAPHGQLTSFKENLIDAMGARDTLTGEVDLSMPVTFKRLREFRRTADEASKFESTNPNAVRDSFRQLRHGFESEIEAAAEPHLNKAGGSLLKDYKAAKAGYQAGKLLEKAAGSGVAAEKTNQFTSLTDKLFGLGAGAVVGHATGPLGGFMSHQLAGYASKQFRKNFDFVVSDVLAKLANVAKGAHVLDAAQEANVRVQKRMDQGMRAVGKGLDGKEVPEMPIVPGPNTFEGRSELVRNLLAQQEGALAHLQEATSPLARAAPNIAGALNTTALRTLAYLAEALPKAPPPPKDSLNPKAFERDWEPSDPQKAAFNRKWEGSVYPELTLARVAAGAYTFEHDQALTATHPKMKGDMGAQLRARLDKQVKAVPAHMRSSVKLFLGVPSVDPGLGRMMQANYEKPQAKPPAPARPLKLNTDRLTLP